MWTYKAKNGETITIRDPNLKSIMEREGFKLVEGEKPEKTKKEKEE